MRAYIYEISSTLNGKVNYESLFIELSSSPVPGIVSTDGIKGRIQVEVAQELSTANITILDGLIASHTGSESRTTQQLRLKRENILAKLVDMAHHHPVLKIADSVNVPAHTGEDVITRYLTSIDNYLNAWVRDGNHTPVVEKITEDANLSAMPINEYSGFLNTVVDLEGTRTFEFLIAGIPSTPYI